MKEALAADLRIDIRDEGATREAVGGAAPEIVFHLAAQPLVLASYEQPVETFATNVMGTAHVLAGASDAPSVRAVVVATTDKVYENREWPHPYREPDRLGGHDPYASSKACAELLTAAMRSTIATGANIATVRAGNVIGGGDFATQRLVPDCARAFAAGEPVRLRHPGAVRPFQHVLDPLAGYLMLAENLFQGVEGTADAWNFGPDPSGERTVVSIAQKMADAWDDANVLCEGAETGPHEAGILRLDSTKARTVLGWRPKWDVADTIAHTAAWYRAWAQKAPLSALTLSQIEAYEGAA